MIKIKTLLEIYKELKESFYKKTNIDIGRGTIIDMLFSAIADQFSMIYQTIEDNKKPYLFTKQYGDELDSTGYFVSLPRIDGESDDNYRYRLMNWNLRHASCNATAINDKCKELEFSTAANYVQHTKGIGTATIYLTPLSYDEEDIKLAINEATEKVSTVINPSSRVEFQVPTPIDVKLVAYLKIKTDGDQYIIKQEINNKVKEYINSIAPGSYLELGDINEIGLAVESVEYFNVVQVYLDDKEATDFEILQTIKARFVYNQIIWWDVES